MNKNQNNEYDLVIYSILLNISDNIFTSLFLINREQGMKHMNKIAELGGTKEMFNIQIPDDVEKTFNKIAKAITPKYGLKIN